MGKELDNENYFIRIGEIPTNEKSKIYRSGEIIGEEIGVSVYDCVIKNEQPRIVLPEKVKDGVIDSLYSLYAYDERNIYLVTGDIVGYGSDGEPLLKNVKIIRAINNIFSYNKVVVDKTYFIREIIDFVLSIKGHEIEFSNEVIDTHYITLELMKSLYIQLVDYHIKELSLTHIHPLFKSSILKLVENIKIESFYDGNFDDEKLKIMYNSLGN